MTNQPEQLSYQEQPAATVVTHPLEIKISNDFAGNYAFTRRGVEVAVVMQGSVEPIYSKDVWQRGTYLPIRPFYERRLARALQKAGRVAGSLSVKHSGVELLDQVSNLD